jgi:hypothetical protein
MAMIPSRLIAVTSNEGVEKALGDIAPVTHVLQDRGIGIFVRADATMARYKRIDTRSGGRTE